MLELNNPANLVTNNLGGMGPVLNDPPYITMRDVTTLRNQPVRLRIFNASVYNPSLTRNNRYLRGMMQINLRNIFGQVRRNGPKPWHLP